MKKLMTILAILFTGVVSAQNLERTADEFTGKVTISTSFNNTVILHKSITEFGTKYYLSLHAKGSTCIVDGAGVYIKLDDNTNLIKTKEEIDIEVNDSGGYTYSAFVTLTPAEVKILTTKTIIRYKLYVFTNEVLGSEAIKFKDEVAEILTMV